MTDEKASCFFCTKLAVDKRGDFRRGTKSVTSRNMHGLGCCERDTWLPQLTWSMIGWWQSSFTSLIAGRLRGSLIKAQSAKPPTQPRVPSASTLHIHPKRQISSIIHHTRDGCQCHLCRGYARAHRAAYADISPQRVHVRCAQ